MRNRGRPKGCIAERYLAEKCLTFCSLYLDDDVETRLNRINRNDDDKISRPGLDVFSNSGRLVGKGIAKPLDTDT